MTTEKTKATAE